MIRFRDHFTFIQTIVLFSKIDKLHHLVWSGTPMAFKLFDNTFITYKFLITVTSSQPFHCCLSNLLFSSNIKQMLVNIVAALMLIVKRQPVE